MRLFFYSLWAALLLVLVSAEHISYVKNETRPTMEDEFEYGYLSIPYYHLTLNKNNIPANKENYLQKKLNSDAADLTLLHKYLALNYHFFGKNLNTFRLSILPLFILLLLSVFLVMKIMTKKTLYAMSVISLLVSSPGLISYSRMLWTPLYSSAFIFLGIFFYVRKDFYESKKNIILTALSLMTASMIHYSGILFSGIIMFFIICFNFKDTIKHKKMFLLFLFFYFLPQIKTFPLMMLSKTKGCINAINPPSELSGYMIMLLPSVFWFKLLFWFISALFIASFIHLIKTKGKNISKNIYLFYLLMLPSLWLIKINTGLQTHFIMCTSVLVIGYTVLGTHPKFRFLNRIILAASVVGISLNFLHPTPFDFKDDFFTKALKADRKNFAAKKVITALEKQKDFVSTIAVLNPDEFSHSINYPLDELFLELSLTDSDDIFLKSLNNESEIRNWTENKNIRNSCLIVEENKYRDIEIINELKRKADSHPFLRNKIVIEGKYKNIILFFF